MPKKKDETIYDEDEKALRKIMKGKGFKAEALDGFIDGFEEGYNEGADLSERRCSQYTRYLMGCWDDNAYREAIKKDLLKVAGDDIYQMVCNLLQSGNFTIRKIAKFAQVNDDYVKLAQRIIKPRNDFPPVSAISKIK